MRADEPAAPAPDQPEPDYPTLFRTYVVQSVENTLATFVADAAQDWDAARARALHVLSFSFALAEAWPATRDLLLQLAPKMEQAGHRDDWLPYLEHGVARSQAQADRLAEAELTLFMGELFRLRSKFDLARQWLDHSVTIFAALGADQGHARALNELAFVAWQQHRYDEAEALAHRALMLLDEDNPDRATSISHLGLVAIDRRQWEEAERYHQTALKIRQQHDDLRKSAWSLQNCGYALRGQGKYEQAIAYYEQAIAILEEVQDRANWASAQSNLGIVYSLLGQPAKALNVYAQAIQTFTTLHDTNNLAKILTSQGIDYTTLRCWIEAENSFLRSMALFQELDDTGWYLNALDGLGLVYLEQGQPDKAYTAFERVFTLLPQIAGEPVCEYLLKILPTHLERARLALQTKL